MDRDTGVGIARGRGVGGHVVMDEDWTCAGEHTPCSAHVMCCGTVHLKLCNFVNQCHPNQFNKIN